MIRRDNRFHGHSVVARVRGQTVHTPLFSVRCAQTKRKNYRLAVAVSKKIDNRATIRNRIRRRIFEAVRTTRLLEGRPFDCVIYVKSPEVATINAQELENSLRKSIMKIISKSGQSAPVRHAIVEGKEKQ